MLNCEYHDSLPKDFSLLEEHKCSIEPAPINLIESVNHKEEVWHIEFSDDGKIMLVATKDSSIGIWEIKSEVDMEYNIKKVVQLNNTHRENLNKIVFSPDSNFFLTCSSDCTLNLFKSTGEHVKTYRAHRGPIYSAVWFKNSLEFLSISTDCTMKK